ncbi:MAG: alpha-L-fucosidase [Flavobacteriaceae bacterium]
MKTPKNIPIGILTFTLFVISQSCLYGQEKKDSLNFTAKMQWWENARFGMFLHWGPSSIFGSEYAGTDYGKEMGDASSEWIYLTSNMPQEDYEAAARKFNPTDFNPEKWVKAAKHAGMKYMVLTAKHHDGFAMFDTKINNWNIVKASAYKKDIIKQFIDECHKQGMRVGIYYSHEKDWINHIRVRNNTGAVSKAYKKLVKEQLEELLTHYGTIDLFWFDMGVDRHKALNQMCVDLVRKHQPACIINSRIGNGLGDYSNLNDREIASAGNENYVESIMTMRLNWGFDNNDANWKSSKDIIAMLSKTACRNSNFLLNVGPTPAGTFTPEELVRLKAVGNWMDVNAEAIYQTKGSPFSGEYPWGSITSKQNKVYLHVFNWHDTAQINVNGITSTVNKATLLGSDEALIFQQNSNNATLSVFLPENISSYTVPVICLDLSEFLKVAIDKGPVWQPEKIHHVTRKQITGTISVINETAFSITSEETKMDFQLNENIEYRINNKGEIVQTQGFNLKEGQNYKVVYSPFEIPEVEIIVLME